MARLRLVSSQSPVLDTVSRKARQRAAILRRLANDLEKPDSVDDADGSWRLFAVTALLINEEVDELSQEEVTYLRGIRVPPALLVAGAR